MTPTGTYTETMQSATESMAAAMSNWWTPIRSLVGTASTTGRNQFNPMEAWEANLRIARELVAVNVRYAEDLGNAVQVHVAGLTRVFQESVGSATDTVGATVDDAVATMEAQVRAAEQAERAATRQAERAARAAAAERYQDLTKAELAEELGKRDLPRTGNLDDLRERLIDHDLGSSS